MMCSYLRFPLHIRHLGWKILPRKLTGRWPTAPVPPPRSNPLQRSPPSSQKSYSRASGWMAPGTLCWTGWTGCMAWPRPRATCSPAWSADRQPSWWPMSRASLSSPNSCRNGVGSGPGGPLCPQLSSAGESVMPWSCHQRQDDPTCLVTVGWHIHTGAPNPCVCVCQIQALEAWSCSPLA